jgi:hypothetical protein
MIEPCGETGDGGGEGSDGDRGDGDDSPRPESACAVAASRRVAGGSR